MSGAEEGLTIPTVQRQIDTLREQLYDLNEAYAAHLTRRQGGVGTAGGGKQDLTSDERLLLARNDALRMEKNRILKELSIRDPPELLDKKNRVRQIQRSIDATRQEMDHLITIRDQKAMDAQIVQGRQKELQVLQSQCNGEQSDFRVMQRELQAKVKEAEKRMMASHTRVVKLRERIRLGLPAAEAEKLRRSVEQQEKSLEAMELEIRKQRASNKKLYGAFHERQAPAAAEAAASSPKSSQDKAKELDNLAVIITHLDAVLASRETEFRRSYDYAARYTFAVAAAEAESAKAARREQKRIKLQQQQQQDPLPELVTAIDDDEEL